jgi:hypothetical protein
VTGAADSLGTAWYRDEPFTGPQFVTKERFKQAFNDELCGQIYAQPLAANGTLLVVTEDDWAAPGNYRLTATPINREGVHGVTRHVEFQTFH